MVLAMAAGFAFSDAAGGESYAISGPIPARVIRVIDGDTVIVRAKIWLGQEVETRVRLAGVDTPEINGKCENERRLAKEARDLVRRMLGRQGEVMLSDIHYGKYAGRVVARVDTSDGEDFSGALIRAGLGGRYDGGPRLNWCE